MKYRKRYTLFSLLMEAALIATALVACGDVTATSREATTTVGASTSSSTSPGLAPTGTPIAINKLAPTTPATISLPATTNTGASQPTTANPFGYKPVNLKHSVTGGTFQWRDTSEPATIDPSLASDPRGLNVVVNVFDGLVELLPDSSIGPSIASAWKVSADGLTYTFTLRQDVKFSNGDQVNTKDFVYSWRRLLSNPDAPYSFVMDEIQGIGRKPDKTGIEDLRDLVLNEQDPLKKGAEQVTLDKALDNLFTTSIKVLDDYTLNITLVQPAAYFLTQLTLWPYFVVDQKVIEKFGDKWTEAGNLVGTGAFLLKEWQHEQNITLVYNPNYFGGRAGIDEVDIAYVKEDATARLKYDNGELDDIAVPIPDVPKLAKDPKYKDQFHNIPFSSVNWLGFNLQTGPFATNKKLRMAFFSAFDRELLVNGALQGADLATTTLLPPGLQGYKPYDAYPFDPNKAKQYLREAGYDTPDKVKQLEDEINNHGVVGKSGGLAYIGNIDAVKLWFENLQQQLKENLGLNLKLNPISSPKEFYQRRGANHEFLLYLGGWGADYPDAQNFYQPLFGCNEAINAAQYCNPAYDAAWKKGNTASTQEARNAAYQEAEKILDDDAALVPLFNRTIIQLTKPYIQNWGYGVQSSFVLKYMEIRK